MDGSVAQLASAFNDLAAAGIDPNIFRFRVVGVHAAQRGQLQPAVALDGSDHSAQSVGVGGQH